ncbi:uncharacterized protein LACBIDRAFT_294324 [Laccaria bicolor S238N-H82]|uniref:Predicted protein n=1 Tax=Laccaria bicolor (strain S238N-H82 / ATCC MYA-4686) TaxID=486041 RepID=B0DBE5_LACBS|nr:uncharacterized protein LACBIDRAFT_294324 [Laccaria bicolor S238N-H82]EDR08177.1 predicted protein [Laccaria bicolor S238N-H82]|eukprot:XP_001881247.1 predicted protein [Laccaria bicolor S238N-H82]
MLRTRTHSSGPGSPSSGSPPGSPKSPKTRLSFSGVANMFAKMRRLEERAAANNSQQLPPLSPSAKVKPHHLISSSGEPCTHPGLLEGASEERVDVEFIDHYECAGGVNVGILLRATRSSLVERVEDLGANALVEEQWECTICGPKNGIFRVQVRYIACAANSTRPDPHKPVGIDQAKGVPGLMTILKRNEFC